MAQSKTTGPHGWDPAVEIDWENHSNLDTLRG